MALMKRLEHLFQGINKGEERSVWIRGLVLIISNWIFQGIFYMDRTERWFRLSIELLSILLLALLIQFLFSPWTIISVLITFLLVHTANWIMNCQFLALMRKFNLVRTTKEEFDGFQQSMIDLAKQRKSIDLILLIGSISRNNLNPFSDIDVRIIRTRGIRSGISSCLFATAMRIKALGRRIPLDLYVFDSRESLRKMGGNEKPVQIYPQD